MREGKIERQDRRGMSGLGRALLIYVRISTAQCVKTRSEPAHTDDPVPERNVELACRPPNVWWKELKRMGALFYMQLNKTAIKVSRLNVKMYKEVSG